LRASERRRDSPYWEFVDYIPNPVTKSEVLYVTPESQQRQAAMNVTSVHQLISQLTNLCKTLAAAILLTSSTHFGARLGAFFYSTRCFENNVPFDNTAQLYLINLHWKLGLGFKLRLWVALF